MKFFKSNLLSALERVFKKAKSLVRNDGLVLEKPGETDGSYIVQGLQTAFFVPLLGEEGLLNVTEVALIAARKSANISLQ